MPESLSLKQSVVKQLDGIAAPETIIASNSSSYTITDIVKGLDLSAADRFVSLHSCMSHFSIIWMAANPCFLFFFFFFIIQQIGHRKHLVRDISNTTTLNEI